MRLLGWVGLTRYPIEYDLAKHQSQSTSRNYILVLCFNYRDINEQEVGEGGVTYR